MHASRIRCEWLMFGLVLLGSATAGAGGAAEDSRDPVAAWEIQRVTLDMRVHRLPADGAVVLWLPVGAPAPAAPRRLTAERVEALIEKLDLYSGPGAPQRMDGVVLEINATGLLEAEDLVAVEKLMQVLQIHEYPVIAWVHGTAEDEAAWVALSADRIFMHPAGWLGGASADPLRDLAERTDPTLRAWVRNKAGFAGSVAESKGYNSDVARAMVDGAVELRRVAIDGHPYWLTVETVGKIKTQRPGAVIDGGAVVKKSGDRLRWSAVDAVRPEAGLSLSLAASRAELWSALGARNVEVIEMALAAPPPATIANGWQAAVLLLLVLLVLVLVAAELVMEMRGYALTAGAGMLLSYLAWAATRTPLGGPALGLFLAAVAMVVWELFRPTRRGRLGVLAFALIGFGLGLTLIQDAPYLDASWHARHMAAELRPALQNAGLVLSGGTLAAAAVGLMTLARLRRLPRYSQRWRRRHEPWNESRVADLQRQVGRRGVTLTAIAPRLVPSGYGVEASAGQVEIDGRAYEATCVGAIATGQEIEVVDTTEEHLVVRLAPLLPPAVLARPGASKYEAPMPDTKYAGMAAETTEREDRARDAGTTVPEPKGKYPPSAPAAPSAPLVEGVRKYPPGRERSKYTPSGGTPNDGAGGSKPG